MGLFSTVGGLAGTYFGGPAGGAAGSAIGGMLDDDSSGAAGTMQGAAGAAGQAAAFNPYGVQGAFGTTSFDGNQANIQLSPQMQQIQDLYGQQALGFAGQGQTALGTQAGALGQQFLGGIQADPFQAAETQFGRMEAILNPSRERQRESLEARLLKQGRLGSTGGALQQEGLETAIDQSRQQGLVNALQQSQALQMQQAGLGQQLGLFGQQQQDVGFNQAQARLGGMQGIDSQMLDYLRIGGALGGQGAQAGANVGRFGMEGAGALAAEQLGQFKGQREGEDKLVGAFGDYFNQPDNNQSFFDQYGYFEGEA